MNITTVIAIVASTAVADGVPNDSTSGVAIGAEISVAVGVALTGAVALWLFTKRPLERLNAQNRDCVVITHASKGRPASRRVWNGCIIHIW